MGTKHLLFIQLVLFVFITDFCYGSASDSYYNKIKGKTELKKGSYMPVGLRIFRRKKNQPDVNPLFTIAKIFPNPADDFTEIVFVSEKEGQASLRVFDENHRLVKEQEIQLHQFNTEKYTLETSGLTPGTYFLEACLNYENGKTYCVLKKLIKK